MSKKWVTAKKDLAVAGKIIPKGTLGFIKENAHVKEEEGAVQFPQTVAHFKKRDLEILDTSDLDIDTLLESIEVFQGHYCKRDGEFQFNIKLYGQDIPQRVRDNFDDGQIYMELSLILGDMLQSFVDKRKDDASLQADFPWIKYWRQEGRSGGWLVIRHVNDLSAEVLRDQWEEAKFDMEEAESNSAELDVVEGIESAIIDLALDLQLIKERVKRAKDSVLMELLNEENWYRLLETIDSDEPTDIVYTCPNCRHTHKLDVGEKLPQLDLVYSMLYVINNRLSEQSDTEYLAFKEVFNQQISTAIGLLKPFVKEGE